MKTKVRNLLPLALAGLLQFMPILRSALPTLQSLGSPTGALILRWVAGGVAFFGYHAISSASSVSISPPTATIGTHYTGTVSYSGGHAGQVVAMSMSNTCLGSYTLAPGLTISYSGGYTASVTGTPSGTAGTMPFTVKVWDGGSCSGGLTDTRSTSLIIQSPPSSNYVPAMTVSPQNVISQVGANVILSGGATGNPTPTYIWKQGITPIPGATNNTLLLSAVQMTNGGVYTLYASNNQGVAAAACYLTVALTPGSNILAYQYTNYAVAGTPVAMTSFITNAASASNTYAWEYNYVNTGVTTSNLNLSSAQTTPLKSGTYTINFNSTVAGNQVVNNQAYDSYWMFGYQPVVTNQPSPVTVNAGSNATFSVTLAGSTYSTVSLYQNQTTLMAQTNLAAFNPSTAAAATNVSLAISNVTQANAGSYTFVVTNFWGSTTSSPAALTVISPLSVTTPQSQTNYAGKGVSFSVTATGAAPLTYQWQKGGINLSNGVAISGAATNALSISPAATTDSGNYRVVVTNSAGSVTSSVAVLSIVPVPQFALSPASSNMTLSASGGIPGSNYVVQVSTNLANTNGWAPVKTNAVPANGSVTFTDTNTANSSPHFYRVQFP